MFRFDTIRPFPAPPAPDAMNFEQARFNMVEQQIRPWEVLDPQVLDLLFEVKRELFVPSAPPRPSPLPTWRSRSATASR